MEFLKRISGHRAQFYNAHLRAGGIAQTLKARLTTKKYNAHLHIYQTPECSIPFAIFVNVPLSDWTYWHISAYYTFSTIGNELAVGKWSVWRTIPITINKNHYRVNWVKVLCFSRTLLQLGGGIKMWNRHSQFCLIVKFYTTSKHLPLALFIVLVYVLFCFVFLPNNYH